MPAEPVQIVQIEEDENVFRLNEEGLAGVLAQVPPESKVAVVAVAGAFRTGKSFLLDLFLRYLRAGSEVTASDDWMLVNGKYLEGNVNPFPKSVGGGVVRQGADAGFSWRGGRDRNTTGIWLWGEVFVRQLPDTGEDIAVLLMDTQGMFDSRLTQMLTACIFGLSTLISSHQIYNVQNRIQEDNLQHLALFTEYGRIAHSKQQEAEGRDSEGRRSAAFQRLEFLVRDWQEFEGLEEDELREKIPEMKTYLHEVLETESREHKDLRDVREHIEDCFDDVGAFLLPHPGFEVVNPNFDGDVEKIRKPFRTLCTAYCERTFGTDLVAKKVDGRYIHGGELLHLIKAYVNTFHEATAFPEAKTLLAATSEANDRNAKEAALKSYKEEMDHECKKGYIAAADLDAHNQLCRESALSKFDSIATMGPADDIAKYRGELLAEMDDFFQDYIERNASRDPFRNLEYYAMPLAVGGSSYFASIMISIFCFKPKTTEWDYELGDICTSVNDFLQDIYQLVWLVTLCYIVYKTNGAWSRLKDIFGFVRHAAADPEQRAAMMADGAAMLRASQSAMQADGKKGLKRE